MNPVTMTIINPSEEIGRGRDRTSNPFSLKLYIYTIQTTSPNCMIKGFSKSRTTYQQILKLTKAQRRNLSLNPDNQQNINQ